MYVNIAVLKETQPHEQRVALVPAVVARLVHGIVVVGGLFALLNANTVLEQALGLAAAA